MDPRSPDRRRGRLLFEVPLALVLALIGSYLVLRARVGDGGVALLADHQVLVRVDNTSGAIESHDRPGAHTFVPWFEEVYRLDRRALRYVMGQGGEEADRGSPSLVVRGRAGSNYAFGRVELLFALDSAQADVALVDHGGDRERMLDLVDAYARPALRAAFGDYTPLEIVLPENKQAATGVAREDLSESLVRHGLRVLELSVSKPTFAPEYQEIINRRKVAEQDTERLRQEREDLRRTAEEREAAVREMEEVALEKLERKLAEELRLARREAQERKDAADREAADALTAARLQRDEDLSRAAVIEARHRADASAFEARLAALESQGELAVRAALVERLGSITFDLVPYEDPEDEDERARRTAGGLE